MYIRRAGGAEAAGRGHAASEASHLPGNRSCHPTSHALRHLQRVLSASHAASGAPQASVTRPGRPANATRTATRLLSVCRSLGLLNSLFPCIRRFLVMQACIIN